MAKEQGPVKQVLSLKFVVSFLCDLLGKTAYVRW